MAALTIYGAAATKKATVGSDHANRLKRIEALMDEGAVKYRPSFFRPSAARKVHHTDEHVAGLEPVVPTTEIAPPKPVDKKAEDAKKAAEKKAADEKKKKDDEAKKKKKKKKKKKGAKDESPTEEAQSPASDDDKKKDESAAANGAAGFSGPSSAVSAFVTSTNQTPQSVEEWIAYLMQNPSFEKFSKFIQLAQTGVVKLETFYPVVEKVLANDTGRFHEFGTLCAGSVVTSQSFELLSEVANDQLMEEKVKLTARQYMFRYARVEYVRFLGAVATGDNGQAANDAINVIKSSLANLNTVSVPASPNSPSTSTTRAPAASVTAIYEALAAALTQAATSANDGSVKAHATDVAQQIQSALSTAQSAQVAASGASSQSGT